MYYWKNQSFSNIYQFLRLYPDYCLTTEMMAAIYTVKSKYGNESFGQLIYK